MHSASRDLSTSDSLATMDEGARKRALGAWLTAGPAGCGWALLSLGAKHDRDRSEDWLRPLVDRRDEEAIGRALARILDRLKRDGKAVTPEAIAEHLRHVGALRDVEPPAPLSLMLSESADPAALCRVVAEAVADLQARGEPITTEAVRSLILSASVPCEGLEHFPEAIDPQRAREDVEALKHEEAMDAILGGVEALGVDVVLGMLRDELHRRGFTDDEIDARTRRESA